MEVASGLSSPGEAVARTKRGTQSVWPRGVPILVSRRSPCQVHQTPSWLYLLASCAADCSSQIGRAHV